MAEKAVNKSDKQYIELGKKLDAFIRTGYVSKKEAFIFAFIKGLITGFAAFLGGTVVIALLLWLLSGFDELPIISDIAKSIQNSLHQR